MKGKSIKQTGRVSNGVERDVQGQAKACIQTAPIPSCEECLDNFMAVVFSRILDVVVGRMKHG